GKWGYCDPTLKLKIQYKYDQAGEFTAGNSIVLFEGGFGMIDVMDKIIVPFIYEEIIPMENGFFMVKEKGMYGLMDREHKVLLESKYTKINGVEKYFQLEIGDEYFWFNPETDEIFWNSNLTGQ
ncbi:MAG TPA: WG repeat-containing protein, partial [Ignavibacteriaceae bacterium]